MVAETFQFLQDFSVVEIFTGLVILTVMIFVIFKCTWCFLKASKSDEMNADNDATVSKEQLPPSHRYVKGKSQNIQKCVNKRKYYSSPVISRKYVKFSCPADKKFTTVQVQPSQKSSNGSMFSDEISSVVIQTDPDPMSWNQNFQIEHKLSESKNTNCFFNYDTWRGMQSIACMLLPNPNVLDTEDLDNPVDYNPEGVDCNLGKIQISLNYDFNKSDLRLSVLQAKNLPAKDFSGTSDPYVQVLLLPDKKNKRFTCIKKKNLSPVWNQSFIFEKWPLDKLSDKTLYLRVNDYDRFSRDDPMGEIYIPLYGVDFTQLTTMWRYLQPCKDTRGKLGEILLSLCYQPSVGQLNVIVMKAKDLKVKDFTGSSDPYVKLWLKYGKMRIIKKKTSVKMTTLKPIYNESFVFDIPWSKIHDAELELSVMDFDKIGRNEMIGKIVLGSRSGPLESKHWKDMIMRPRRQVAQWHLLNH